MVTLVEVSTGVTVERAAVDARELVASGSYVLASEADPAPSAGGDGTGGGSGDATVGASSSAAESTDVAATVTKPGKKK